VDSGAGDAVASGQLTEALAALAVQQDGGRIELQGTPADVPASSRARRMPARTRSMMRLRSSSAMTQMMTTTARPSGPAVSICSRKLMNSMASSMTPLCIRGHSLSELSPWLAMSAFHPEAMFPLRIIRTGASTQVDTGETSQGETAAPLG
jgi:hypothetical protein